MIKYVIYYSHSKERETPERKERKNMKKWKVFVRGWERSTSSKRGESTICNIIIVEAETKEEAQQKAKLEFIKRGTRRLDSERPIQYTREIKK